MDLFIIFLEAFGALVALVFGVYGVFIDTTIEKSGEDKIKKKKGLPKLTRHGKIALTGVFIGGMISLVIKIATGVKDLSESKARIREQVKINDSLRDEYKKDQAFKYQVDSSLNSTLKSLNAISENTNIITNKQSENLLLQQLQINDTKKILSPLKPLSLSLNYITVADNPLLKEYYDRITEIKNKVENRKPVDQTGLKIFINRGRKVEYIQVESPVNNYFPNYDDNTNLGAALYEREEIINLTKQGSRMIDTYEPDGFLIHIPTSPTDTIHNVRYSITIYYNRAETETSKNVIEIKLSCDIYDNALIESVPNAPSFSSIYDLREKYILVSGSFTNSLNLKEIIFRSGPDKKTSTISFKPSDKLNGGYMGGKKYYQKKISNIEIP
jgi:hypothetical protein